MAKLFSVSCPNPRRVCVNAGVCVLLPHVCLMSVQIKL